MTKDCFLINKQICCEFVACIANFKDNFPGFNTKSVILLPYDVNVLNEVVDIIAQFCFQNFALKV